MDKKKVTLLLGVLSLVLIAVCMALVVFDNNEAPVITIDAIDRTYYAGDDYEAVLTGVSASDDKDGAVEVLVESIIPLAGKNQAKVFYVAIDSEEAVGKASTIVEYISKSEDPEPEDPENAEADSPAPDETADAFQEEPADDGTQTPGDISDETPEETPEDTSTEEIAEQNVDPAKPVITLTQTEAVLPRGTAFNYGNYIESITDDVDTEADLYRKIIVNHSIDSNVPGVYEVSYYVNDSDGNQSEPAVLRVTVQ